MLSLAVMANAALPSPPRLIRAGRALCSAAATRRRILLDDADVSDWETVIDTLTPLARPERMRRLHEVLSKRRGKLHVVLENVADPFNVAAVLRTAEGLGVQHVHVIESVHSVMHAPATTERVPRASKGALGNVAMGASRWLSVSKYQSSAACCAHLREHDVHIFASDCAPVMDELDSTAGTPERWRDQRHSPFDAVQIDELDFEASAAGGGAALIFGNERRGVSRSFIERADRSFYLPMCGLTQSFNISVAVAMSLYHAVASGAFPEGTLPEAERAQLLGRWLMRDVKAARQVLLQAANLEFTDF